MTKKSGEEQSPFAGDGTLRGAMIDWCVLGLEASLVLPLRLWRLSWPGAAAHEEARLMVTEKVEAHAQLARHVASGAMGKTPGEVSHGVARHYLGYVRANRRRLLGAVQRRGAK